MKIISVRFANLNSLPGPYLIRFDDAPLADTGLICHHRGPRGRAKARCSMPLRWASTGGCRATTARWARWVSRHAEGRVFGGGV
ncbi:MAG: hypothetical protein WKG07_04960 [Hymenobacter sp.]